jgi:hypothetical protein
MRKTLLAVSLAAATAASVFAAPQVAYAADKKAPAAIGAPEAGKGQVVFFRTGGLMGAAISCNVRDEAGVMVGALGGGKYFVVQLDPGKRTFTTKSEAKDTLNMEIESGETYYVRCTIGMGVMAGRPNIAVVEKAVFDEKSKGLKLKDTAQLTKERDKDTKEKAKK